MPEEPPVAAHHLRELARRPRFAGSVEELDARAYARGVLESHGFSVTEEPFAYSEAIGRWMVPVTCFVVAAALGWTGLVWRAGGQVVGAGLALLALGFAVAFTGRVAAQRWVLSFPTARRTSTNLVASRGSPATWLVAHLDTKSQPVPTLVRAALLVALAGSLLATILVGLFAPGAAEEWWILPLAGAVSGVVLSFVTVGNESPGAADNASGVATVLRVVEQLPAGAPLGIVLPSAEELGLAGMRAWVRSGHRAPGVAINVDTVDDAGVLRCMMHGRRARDLASAVVDAAAGLPGAGPVRVSGLIPGLLTDGVALGDAGWVCVTMSRGNLTTLARIHRPGDSVGSLTGEGVELLSRLLLRLIHPPE